MSEPTGETPTEPDVDVAELKHEVDELKAQLDTKAARAARTLRWRKRLVIALAVLTCFGVFASAVSIWGHRTLLNTNAYVKTVAPLAKNTDVTDALSVYLTNEIFNAINAQQIAADALPEKAQVLAGPLTGAIKGYVQQGVAKVLASDAFYTVWVNVNRFAHEQIVKILRGNDSGVVTNENGVVTLNLVPLISQVMVAVQNAAPGLFGDKLPKIDPNEIFTSDNLAKIKSQLESSLNRTLPDNFGQIVVFQSDKLAAAQNAVKLFDRLLVALLIITVLLFAATVWLSTNRRRTLIGLGIGSAIALVLTWATTRIIMNMVTQSITDPTNRKAVVAAAGAFLGGLRNITVFLVAAGLVMAFVAFVTGSTPLALRLRAWAGRSVDHVREHGLPKPPPEARAWIGRNSFALRVGGLVATLFLLAVMNLTIWSFLVLLVLFGLYEVAVAVLTPPAPPEAPEPPTGSTAEVAATG